MRNGAMAPAVGALLLALAVLGRTGALPVSSSFLGSDAGDYDDSYEDDYDVVIDQRQNGTANVRVSVDGVLLALPAPELPSSASLAGATLLELFASQLAAGAGGVGVGGDLEDDVSDELYAGSAEAGPTVGSNASSAPSTAPGLRPATSTTTTPSTTSSSTTTAATTPAPAPAPSPPSLGGLSNDFAFETLPVSLLGQGLNFLFNTRRTGEIPFRVNPSGADPATRPVPLLITKVAKAGPHRAPDSSEESRELADAPEQSGKRKRKHKRKYKVRMASMLRPLLKRTALRH